MTAHEIKNEKDYLEKTDMTSFRTDMDVDSNADDCKVYGFHMQQFSGGFCKIEQ